MLLYFSTPSSFAASGIRALGEGAAKGTLADAGVICQPELSRKINL
jgi:hypothetical protein